MGGEQMEILGAVLMLYGLFEWFYPAGYAWRGLLVVLAFYIGWVGYFEYRLGHQVACTMFGITSYILVARFIMLWCSDPTYTNSDPDDLL